VVYVYNPSQAPQHFGSLVILPLNFQVVTEAQAEQMRQARIEVLLEGDADFPCLWERHIPEELPPLSSG
jgi:hypothetical protein